MRLWVVVFSLFIFPLWAELAVTGAFIQGGYIAGKVSVGSHVQVGGEAVFVGPRGHFLYGIPRFAQPELQLRITSASGAVEEQVFIIEPRTYKTQHISGVPKNTVNPNKEELDLYYKQKAAIKEAKKAVSTAFVPTTMSWPVSNTITGVYGSRRLFDGQERSWHKGGRCCSQNRNSNTSASSRDCGICRRNLF